MTITKENVKPFIKGMEGDSTLLPDLSCPVIFHLPMEQIDGESFPDWLFLEEIQSAVKARVKERGPAFLPVPG